MREEDFGDLSKLMEAVDEHGIVFVMRGGREIEDDLVVMKVGDYMQLLLRRPETASLAFMALDRGGG
jgi:hypothetical protein